MISPKRMNILNIISGRVPCNPCLADIEARLRSLEEKGLPLPDVEDFIESLDFIDKKELNKALSEYDFTSLIESMSLVNQEQLDNALASYVENALEPYALKTSLEGFATWTSLNTEVERLDSKIDNIDLTGFATKSELDDAVNAIDLTGFATKSELNERATKSQVNTEVQRLDAKIDNIDLTGFATKQELNDAVEGIDLTGFATKSELNDAVEGIDFTGYVTNTHFEQAVNTLATKQELNTEVTRLDAKIDNIDLTGYATKQELNDAVNGIDLTGFATKSELNEEIARLEAEIEQIASKPSGPLPGSHELKASNFGDFVLAKGREYFAVTPSEYNTEIYPLEVYNPIGFVAYPVHWGLSGGLFTRVLSFRYLTNESRQGCEEPVSRLCFRGTNDAFEYPEFQEYWNGIVYLDESMCGKENTSYILKNLMDVKYQEANPSNEAVAGNFPAFAAAMQFDPTGTKYSSQFSAPYWYIPAYGEVSQVKSSNTQLSDILGSFIEKTGGSVITMPFAAAMMTSTLAEKPENAGSGYDGWYKIIDNALEPSESHAFTATCTVRPMIRLI